MPDTRDIVWVAGLLEGEAWFGANRATPVISLSMLDEDVVSRASQVLGASRVLTYEQNDCRRPVHRACVRGGKAAGWMMTLYPLMGYRRQEQIRDALATWRQAAVANGRKTHCPAGHPYDEKNTALERRGQFVLRHCRTCKNEKRRKG